MRLTTRSDDVQPHLAYCNIQAFQPALLLTSKDILASGKGNEGIICYAQDTLYKDIDRAVLKKAGIAILDDPEAFLEIDESSAVISCGPDIPVREIVSDIARPVVMIWDRFMDDEQTAKFDGAGIP